MHRKKACIILSMTLAMPSALQFHILNFWTVNGFCSGVNVNLKSSCYFEAPCGYVIHDPPPLPPPPSPVNKPCNPLFSYNNPRLHCIDHPKLG